MLRAIRGLGGTLPIAPQPSIPQDAAERRQLTVMFCDLVGSTALSARLDPEDLRAVIAAYHRCSTAMVERHGGFVAKYMGDGVLAYFGYPQAHEDDSERAVRAGLALVEAVAKLKSVAEVTNRSNEMARSAHCHMRDVLPRNYQDRLSRRRVENLVNLRRDRWWPRCKRLPTGSKSSECPSTLSALPRTRLIFPFSLI
jgi:hypothetical protein